MRWFPVTRVLANITYIVSVRCSVGGPNVNTCQCSMDLDGKNRRDTGTGRAAERCSDAKIRN